MASSGPNTGTTFETSTGVGNDASWSFVENAAVEDGGIALAVLECSVAGSGRSHYLDSTSHGFSIPGGSTINGIILEVKRYAGSTQSTIFDDTIRLLKSGTPSGSDKASGDVWPNTNTFKTYGSSSDLWGTTWSVSEVNASNFGARLRAVDFNCDADAIPPDNEHNAYVDCMRITVHYTESSGVPKMTSLLLTGIGSS